MRQSSKNIILTAAILGALSVAIGAFGAHSLKAFLMESGRSATFETAVKYQFYHTLALLVIGLTSAHWPHKFLDWAAYAIFSGIVIFSGSLYLLCATNIAVLGAITPIGGLLMILGWVFLVLGIRKL